MSTSIDIITGVLGTVVVGVVGAWITDSNNRRTQITVGETALLDSET